MEQRISIERLEQAVNIFGSFDENIRLLEQEFSVTVVNRDGELRVEGKPEDTMLACKAIQALLTLSSQMCIRDRHHEPQPPQADELNSVWKKGRPDGRP